ncbi:phage integrase [Metapseudomonas otitidis]|uniref:Bacteriophage integrase n=1 Tax=Metapseudomonas otitidis TaxID=319939 RepID=A0A679GTG1_9GAMM|nr:tyrosine-type recombinase/integrase [Pseudomonas otitidis]BCA30440.1 bacteriophage integrase [Pseudomonas otitidis]
MAVTQLPDGRWRVDTEPIKGKRFRKTFKTKGECLRFERFIRQKHSEDPMWSPKPKDLRKLSELVELWYDLHGQTLTNGHRCVAILRLVAKALGNPVASTLEPAKVARLRARQIANGMSGKSANNRLGYLKSMYNALRQLGVIDYENPIGQMRPVKLQERPLSYLTRPQISELLAALDARSTSPHPRMVARICLATGARWGEAQALTPERLRGSTVVFSNTKSKRVRSVPISDDLADAIRAHWKAHGPFTNCLGVFRKVLISTSIKLPRGQASHVLRHTFASHFVMNGGHIVTLQNILGHASLSMTMRYAHLSQDHLAEAVRFNPLEPSAST